MLRCVQNDIVIWNIVSCDIYPIFVVTEIVIIMLSNDFYT
jgi:hypothetical protein